MLCVTERESKRACWVSIATTFPSLPMSVSEESAYLSGGRTSPSATSETSPSEKLPLAVNETAGVFAASVSSPIFSGTSKNAVGETWISDCCSVSGEITVRDAANLRVGGSGTLNSSDLKGIRMTACHRPSSTFADACQSPFHVTFAHLPSHVAPPAETENCQ